MSRSTCTTRSKPVRLSPALLIATIAVALLAFAATSVLAPAKAYALSFADVPSSHWAWGYIDTASNRNLVNGYTDEAGNPTGYFGPEDSITRGQIVTILYRAVFGNSYKTTDPSAFEYPSIPMLGDVERDYYTAAVTWAFNNGIVTGYKDSKGNIYAFGPNDKITREDLATILFRFANSVAKNGICTGGIPDGTYATDLSDAATISDYAILPVDWCYSNTIIGGKTDKEKPYFDPKANATRAETCKMVVATVWAIEADWYYYNAAYPFCLQSIEDCLEGDSPYSPDRYGFSGVALFDHLKSQVVYGYDPVIINQAMSDYASAHGNIWEEQAVLRAYNYYGYKGPDSCSEALAYLTSCGFTSDEAAAGFAGWYAYHDLCDKKSASLPWSFAVCSNDVIAIYGLPTLPCQLGVYCAVCIYHPDCVDLLPKG